MFASVSYARQHANKVRLSENLCRVGEGARKCCFSDTSIYSLQVFCCISAFLFAICSGVEEKHFSGVEVSNGSAQRIAELPYGYRSYNAMRASLQTLAAECPVLSLSTIGISDVQIDVATLKRQQNTSEEKEGRPSEHRVFILSGEHPRELIAPASLMRFIERACEAVHSAAAPSSKSNAAAAIHPAAKTVQAAAVDVQQAPENVYANVDITESAAEAAEPLVEAGLPEKTKMASFDKWWVTHWLSKRPIMKKASWNRKRVAKGEDASASIANPAADSRSIEFLRASLETKLRTARSGSPDEAFDRNVSGKGTATTKEEVVKNVASFVEKRIAPDQKNGAEESLKQRFRHILEQAEIRLVLNANPRARRKVDEGNLCQRKTLSGVDLNRNWGFKWEDERPGKTDSMTATTEEDFQGSSTNAKGPEAFSESETQLLSKDILRFKPTAFVSVHSGNLGVYLPYGYADVLPSSHIKRMQFIATNIANEYCKSVDSAVPCQTGTAGKYFRAHGNCLDWVYSTITPTPMTFLFEIYDGSKFSGPLREEDEVDMDGETTPRAPEAQSHKDAELPMPNALAATRNYVQPVQRVGEQMHAEFINTKSNIRYQQRRSQVDEVERIHRTKETHLPQRPRVKKRSIKLHTFLRTDLTSNQNGANEAGNSEAKSSIIQTVSQLVSSLEIGSTREADTMQNCFRKFNPHSSFTREATVENWSEALLALIEQVASTEKFKEFSGSGWFV